MLKEKTEIMDEKAILRAIARISYEILERNHGADGLCIIGIKRRGAALAEMISEKICEVEKIHVNTAFIDITPFRDDNKIKLPQENSNDIPFDVTGKKVVLVDDVIFTGRSTRAAIEAVIRHGRPQLLQLAVLVDRGHRELPFRADFVGKNVPTSRSETVKVMLMAYDGVNRAAIFEQDGGSEK
jgi:pyrimidine operon attenuation protein/uracil phosphoribosyltransferase